MEAVRVDVIIPIPTRWGMCTSCEFMMRQIDVERPDPQSLSEDLPPGWRRQFLATYNLVVDVARRFGNGVQFRFFDPRGVPGVFKALLHGASVYPTFVIYGRRRIKVRGAESKGLIEALGEAGAVSRDAR